MTELHKLSDKSKSKLRTKSEIKNLHSVSTELTLCQDVMVSRLLERGNFDDKEEAISRR